MRTFIAIELPAEVQSAIADVICRLRDHLAASDLERAVRWTPPDKLHLTLRFLGETIPSQHREVLDGLTGLSHSPLQLNVGQLGCFPTIRRPSVIWLGIGGDLARLARLQGEVEAVAQRADYVAESRSYSPHLTIGRVRRKLPKTVLRQLGDSLNDKVEIGDLPAAQIHFQAHDLLLVRSLLKPQGAQYTVLNRLSMG